MTTGTAASMPAHDHGPTGRSYGSHPMEPSPSGGASSAIAHAAVDGATGGSNPSPLSRGPGPRRQEVARFCDLSRRDSVTP
jgi:hypothetical protein